MSNSSIKVHIHLEDVQQYIMGVEVPVVSLTAYTAQPNVVCELIVPIEHFTYYNQRQAASNGYNSSVIGVIKK